MRTRAQDNRAVGRRPQELEESRVRESDGERREVFQATRRGFAAADALKT